jgi:hypothetical protein
MNLGSLSVYLTGKDKGFNRMMSNAQRKIGKVSMQAGKAAITTGAIFGGAAIAGGIKAIRMYAVQEKAVKKLNAVLSVNGDNVEKLMPKYKAFASEIQKQTTYGDESTLAMMAQIRNLGVMPDKMEKATKGAIGLATALDMDAKTSARYTALAMQGEYTILQRYVPALRTATTQAEKQKIVMDLMNKGYQQAQAETETLTGAQAQMGNTWGDTQEKFGKFLVTALKLPQAFNWITEKLKILNNELDSGMLEFFAIEAEYGFKKAWMVGQVFFHNIGLGVFEIADKFTTLTDWLPSAFESAWRNIGAVSMSVLNSIISTYKDQFKALVNMISNPSLANLKGLGSSFNPVANFQRTMDAAITNLDIPGPNFKEFKDGYMVLQDELGKLEGERIAKNANTIAVKQDEINKKQLEKIKPPDDSKAASGKTSAKFAGAVEKGSVAAYKAALGGKKTAEKTEKNTSDTVKVLKEVKEAIIETAQPQQLALATLSG